MVPIIVMGIIFLTIPIGFLILVLLSYITTRSSRGIILYSFLLAIVFGIAGFCFKNPATDPDLVRYLQILSTYEGKGLFESFNTAYTNLYAVDIMFWFIANLGIPQLLPAMACFIYYFIVLYIIGDYKIISGIKNLYFLIYFLFTICATNFGSIVNGIRWPLAFATFFLAIYRDLYKKQRSFFTYFLYIAALFMHFSVVGLILVRLVMFLHNKKRVLVYSMGISLLPQILQILSERLGGVQTSFGFINRILYFINRSNMYFQWEGGGWADIVRRSNYYRFEKYYYIFISVLFTYMILRDYQKMSQSGWSLNEVQPAYIFMFTYMILTLVTFMIASHVYIRFVLPAIPLLSLVFFDDFGSIGDRLSVTHIHIRKLPILTILLGLSAAGAFMNLYFIRTMVNLGEFLTNILTFSFLFPFLN